MAFKAQSKALSKKFTQYAKNKAAQHHGGKAPPISVTMNDTGTTFDDDEVFDLNKLKKNNKEFANQKELKITFDHNGKPMAVKEPNFNNIKIISPEINLEPTGDGR